jgi:RNA polymerase sigma factor (sigma-70 family)
MYCNCTTNDSSLDLERVILACSETVLAMARRFARNCWSLRLEADDLYATGMLAVCEAAPHVHVGVNPLPYLTRAAKFAMIDEYRRARDHSSTVSLDAPLTNEDEAGTLLDLLAAPVPGAPAVDLTVEEAALYAALRRLPRLQGAVLAARFGVDGYGASTLKEAAYLLQTTVASVDSSSIRGRRKLAHDVQLCEALGLEVAQ